LNQKKLQDFMDQLEGEDGEPSARTMNVAGPSTRPSVEPTTQPTAKDQVLPLDSTSAAPSTSAGVSFPLLEGASGLGAFDGAAELFQGSDINMGSADFMREFNARAHPASLKPVAGGLMDGLMTAPWMDYTDAVQAPFANLGGTANYNTLQDEPPTFLGPSMPNGAFNFDIEPLHPYVNPFIPVVTQNGKSAPTGSSVPGLQQTEEQAVADSHGADQDQNEDIEGSEVGPAKRGGAKKRKNRAGASKAKQLDGSTEVAGVREGRETKRARKVNARQEMTDWMCQAQQYLLKGLNRGEWVGLLDKWWLWEERSAPLASATARLPAGSYRPTEVSKWLQKKEFGQIPTPDDLERYARAWLEWWEKLKEADEVTIKKPGKSGLVVMVVALKWWEPLNEGNDERWTRAVGEMDKIFNTWVS
jgi:hypothetical protein